MTVVAWLLPVASVEPRRPRLHDT